MSTPKRATVYFDPEVHKALRLRAAANDQSISDMVNEAVRASLAEDAIDLAEEPRPHGAEKLAGNDDRYRVRQGNYRIVYSIDDKTKQVTVVKIGHRKDVYR